MHKYSKLAAMLLIFWQSFWRHLPDDDDDDGGLFLGVVVTVMYAPFDRPKTVGRYGCQHPRWCEYAVVVDDHPDAAEDATERPVVEQDIDGEAEHRETGHEKVGDGQVADQDGELGAQFLLELIRQQNEQVGDGADDDDDEEEGAENDDSRCDSSADDGARRGCDKRPCWGAISEVSVGGTHCFRRAAV